MTYLPSVVWFNAKDLEIYEIKDTTKLEENLEQQHAPIARCAQKFYINFFA